MNAHIRVLSAADAPPIPEAGRRSGYPFSSLEVGGYFEVPDDAGTGHSGQSKRQNNVCSGSRQWAARYNPTAKFVTRLFEKPDGSRWVGCWRTE